MLESEVKLANGKTNAFRSFRLETKQGEELDCYFQAWPVTIQAEFHFTELEFDGGCFVKM